MKQQQPFSRIVPVAEPCHNFNVMNVQKIIDPMDGREKVVLSNFVMSGIGELILVDPETHTGETIKLPGDYGAWAVTDIDGEDLLVGTCSMYGYAHRLNLRTRTWDPPLRIESELYIWQWAKGSDGCYYGGTWPGCQLVRYDPKERTLVTVCRGSDNEKNMYVRHQNGELPGHILFVGGFAKPFLADWDIEKQERRLLLESPDNRMPEIREVTATHVRIGLGTEEIWLDATTLEQTDAPADAEPWTRSAGIILKSGLEFGMAGQEYFLRKPGTEERTYDTIPVQAPATHIHTITCDEEGTVWGCCGFGQTIFSYRPSDGATWNSLTICNSGGEVYGMAFFDRKLYLTAYAGGDHVVYDPTQPWDQRGNVNPKTLASLGPKLIRPCGFSVVGPDDGIWTGWAATYGVYGGGITRIDPPTGDVKVWMNPVPEQQVVRVTADNKHIWFLTNSGGNGLPLRGDPGHFCQMDTDGNVVFDHVLDEGVQANTLLALDGKIIVGSSAGLLLFDPATHTFTGTIELPEGPCQLLAEPGHTAENHMMLVFTASKLYRVCVRARTATPLLDLPGNASSVAVAPDQTVWFTIQKQLYRLA